MANSNKAEITEENKLVEPLNPTDPVVYLDPSKEPALIPKLYGPSTGDAVDPEEDPNIQNNKDGNSQKKAGEDSTKTDGVFVPIIKLNNQVIDSTKIQTMIINYRGFTPKITLIVNDFDAGIQFGDIPGMNNEIIVILTPGKPGVYKNINIPFYIKKCQSCGDNTIIYNGEYKNMDLEKSYLKQVKFAGSNSPQATNKSNSKPSTWELLYQIANECGLGFAATEDCKDIKDERYRLVQSEKYSDVIQDRVSYGGLNSEQIFDAWVDVYGYLVMVNLPFIFNNEVKPEQLSIIAETGVKGTDNFTDQQEHLPVQRIISNQQHQPGGSNMVFKESEEVVNTSQIKNGGTLNTNYFITPRGNGGKNAITTEDLQIIEDSIDGIEGSNEYEFSQNNFLGFEMEDLPYLQQKEIHKSYVNKRNFKQLKLKMESPNYGLERGTLVNIASLEYDPSLKQKLVQQQGASMTGDLEGESEYDKAEEEWQKENKSSLDEGLLKDNAKGMANPAKSGLYYIAGMEFEYMAEEEKINHYLYLIKKDFTTNIDNKYTRPKINTDAQI